MARMELVKEYERLRKNLFAKVRYWEKKGFVFENREKIIPPRPKKITEASIRRLAKIEPQTILRKGKFTNKETGETITGRTYVKREQKKGKFKPKKTTPEEAIQKRQEHYAKSDRKIGKGHLPMEATEAIENTVESFGGKETKGFEQPAEQPKIELSAAQQKIMDRLYEEYLEQQEEEREYLKRRVESILRKLESFEPKSEWSLPTKGQKGYSSLVEKKTQEVNKAVAIIQDAIDRYGWQTVAQNIANNYSELSAMIEEIMYKGSGREYIEGRNKVAADLKRLAEILAGHVLDQSEAKHYDDLMSQEDYIEERDFEKLFQYAS